MAKKGKNNEPSLADELNHVPKKFQRLLQSVKQAKEKAAATPATEHPWKIQPGESYRQFEERLAQKPSKAAEGMREGVKGKGAAGGLKGKEAPAKKAIDFKLEKLLKEEVDKPPRRKLKRKERKLILKEKKSRQRPGDSEGEGEVHMERVPFGEQALAPPSLPKIKATLRPPRSLTHADGRMPLLPNKQA